MLCSYNLDLDPVTLILDLDLDVLKMYLYTNNEVCGSRHSKVRAQTGQTDTLFCSCDLGVDIRT